MSVGDAAPQAILPSLMLVAMFVGRIDPVSPVDHARDGAGFAARAVRRALFKSVMSRLPPVVLIFLVLRRFSSTLRRRPRAVQWARRARSSWRACDAGCRWRLCVVRSRPLRSWRRSDLRDVHLIGSEW